MRVAVVSDIHANLHALEAVLASIDDDSPDALWCLGDLVGYGPMPNACCAAVEQRADICLIGNHDLAVLGRLDLEDFAPDAADSARWTKSVLEPEHRAFMESLDPQAAAAGDVELYHASARDPVWEYVLTPLSAFASFAETDARIILVGHSHVALAFALAEDRLETSITPGGTELDLAEGRWILNPGSVGQPRDGDPRAAYLILDLDPQRADYRRVDYPIERTQKEIRELGLPDALAERLAHGI